MMVAQRYLWCWAVRFCVNVVRLSLLTSLAGYTIFTLFFVMLVVTDGKAPQTWVGHAITTLTGGFNVMLAGVTGAGDFEGGPEELGAIAIAFLAPYLLWFNVGLSVLETLLGRSLTQGLTCPLKRQLQVIGGLGLVALGLVLFQSPVSPSDLPYRVRFLVVVVLFSILAFQLVLLRVGFIATERLIHGATQGRFK
jgi:hypothetical protein